MPTTLWDREVVSHQPHKLKIAGSIPAPTALLALCLGKQLEVVMGKPILLFELPYAYHYK